MSHLHCACFRKPTAIADEATRTITYFILPYLNAGKKCEVPQIAKRWDRALPWYQELSSGTQGICTKHLVFLFLNDGISLQIKDRSRRTGLHIEKLNAFRNVVRSWRWTQNLSCLQVSDTVNLMCASHREAWIEIPVTIVCSYKLTSRSS